ncbi:FERM domain-containing protein 5, partial [Clonorchis sinensis]
MQSAKVKKSPGSGFSSPGKGTVTSEGQSRHSRFDTEQNHARSLSSPAENRSKSRGQPIPLHTNLDDRKEDPSMNLFMVEVKLLSDEEAPLQLEVTNSCLGRALFNQVIERLNGIVAKDYFGLRYLDRNKQRQWLEMSKTVYKQLKHVTPRSLNFRVKHYPSDPLAEFRQEKTRYLLYLQLRRDLHSGRLIGRNTEMHMLAACILQAEIGDHDVLVEYLGSEGTLADLKMFANVTPRTEAKICELHKTLKGLSMEEAENKFLEHASRFETYGIEPLYVQRRHTLGFKCPTAESAEALWKWAVDRQCFFTLSRSVDAKESKANGGIFKRRQFYTFTGRCQKELMLLNSSLPTIPQPSVSRSRSLLNLAKSVRQTRQSKSQNDLDRKLAVSHDNLHDGDMNSSTALQRHQSA